MLDSELSEKLNEIAANLEKGSVADAMEQLNALRETLPASTPESATGSAEPVFENPEESVATEESSGDP